MSPGSRPRPYLWVRRQVRPEELQAHVKDALDLMLLMLLLLLGRDPASCCRQACRAAGHSSVPASSSARAAGPRPSQLQHIGAVQVEEDLPDGEHLAAVVAP